MNTWYEDKIEEPMRDIVRILRNNGINTECSCGHEQYIQCQYIPEGDVYDIHRLLWNHFDSLGIDNPSFTISVKHQVIKGHQYSSLQIDFPIDQPHLKHLEKKRIHLEEQLEHHKKFVKYFEERLKLIENDIGLETNEVK